MRTDTQLLEAYVDRGDRSAFDALVARHYPHVHQVVLRLVHNEFDARDLCQNVFVKALAKADQVRDPERFRGWLLRIAVNEVRSHWRRRKPPAPVDELQLAFEEARGPEVASEASRREFELELEKALEHMPAHLKTPLVLYYYQSLSLAEVGEILGLAKSTVQHRVEKAVARLRRRFAKRNGAVLLPLLAAEFPTVASAQAATGVSALLAGGALIMKAKLAVGIAAVVLVAVLAYVGGVFGPAPDATDDPDVALLDGVGAEGGTLEGRGTADDASPTEETVPTDALPTPVIQTNGSGRIVGHVISASTGKGVPGVRIALVVPAANDVREDDAAPPPTFENVYWSDADGAFVCDRLPTGHGYELVFTHDAHAYAQQSAVAFRPSQQEVDLGAVVLMPALAIEGRVVDPDGAPIAGAAVTAGDPRGRPMPVGFDYKPGRLRGALAQTDAGGRFRLSNLAAGYHRLMVRKAGYATVALGEVHVAPGRAPLGITMHPAETLEIVVQDPDGRTVEGALVDVRLDESVRAGRQGFTRRFTWALERTDMGGRVTVTDLPRAREISVVLEVTHPAYAEFYETFGNQPASPYRITLQPVVEVEGHPVRVRIQGPDGEVVAGTDGYVQISGEGSTGYFERKAPIAASGATTVEGVPPGEHYVYVLAKGYRYSSQTVEVGAGPLDVDVTLSRGAVARGTVRDAVTGEPIEGAIVRQNEVNAVETNARGRFELFGLAGGHTQFGAMRVEAPGYLPKRPSVPFAKGETQVLMVVLLQPVSALRTVNGAVQDPGGRPVAGALLGIEMSGDQDYTVRARSGIDGRFAFQGLVPDHIPDPLRVRVLHPRFAPADIELARSTVDEPLAITLKPGRTVRGRVVDEAGTPVAGASVGVISTDRWWKIEGERIGGNSLDSWTYRILPYLAGSGATDADGRFALTHLPDDALQVLAFGRMTTWLVENGKTGAYVARGGADQDDVVIRVRRGWALRGRVVDAAGKPVAGARISAEGVSVSDFTRRDGTFDLSPVFRDTTTVRVGGEDWRAQTEVARGEGARLEIEATPQGAVHAKVLDASGQPVAGATIALADAPDGPATTSGQDGGFSLYKLPIGRVALEVTLGERTTRVTVDVKHKHHNEPGPIVLK
ncbi:MAG: sigma-70 family RNA polymerase sigma factor [Planctomycetota bacterium]|nr:sigma-70 family RNA polymerase sigma factor [Planctomycetota bacterium]